MTTPIGFAGIPYVYRREMLPSISRFQTLQVPVDQRASRCHDECHGFDDQLRPNRHISAHENTIPSHDLDCSMVFVVG